jgi:hypothetical protein
MPKSMKAEELAIISRSCWRKILGPYRKCTSAVQPRETTLVFRGAFAIGGFVQSRWLLAADAGELWGLLGSLSIL